MAAGIVYHDITTSSGVTFSLACWVPDTSAPDVGAIPVSLPILSDGTTPTKSLDDIYTAISASSPIGSKAVAASVGTAIASDQPIISVVHDVTKMGGGNAGLLLTPQKVVIGATSSGTNNIIAAVTGKIIRVLSFSLCNIGGSTVTAKFQSDAGGTPVTISGKKGLPIFGSGWVESHNPAGWFDTGSGKTLDLNLTAANEVSGELVYVTV